MITVLVVDDEVEIANHIQRLLQTTFADECEVLSTTVSWAGKDILQTQVIDILLTDIRMPGLDGFALAQIARQNNADCRIIFLTGHQEFNYAYEALKLGCNDFLLKINSDEEILRSIRKTLERVYQEVKQRELLQEAERLRNYHKPESASDNNPVEYAKSYIWDHLDSEISLNLLAQRVYLNPSYLSRLFRQSAGMTITEYLLEARVTAAKKYLQETDLKVQDIAKRLGIESSAYFGRMFKKSVGCTPLEYRANHYDR